MDSTKLIVSVSLLVVFLAWETLSPYHDFFRGHTRHRLEHGLKNIVLGIIAGVFVALIFVSLWVWASQQPVGLLNWITLPPWQAAIVAILLFDLWTYWWHRLNHIIPFLWRFHSVHHSDNEMDVTTATRFHFGEIVLSSILRIPVILLIGAEFWHLVLYEAIMFPVVQFHHANIGLPPWLERSLRLVIPTPAMHKIHHSQEMIETNSNYTSLLSIWDRMFKSFRMRPDVEAVSLGLKGRSDENFSKLMTSPFRKKK